MPNYIGSGKGSGGNGTAEKSFSVWVERSPVCSLAWLSNLYNGLIYHLSGGDYKTVRKGYEGTKKMTWHKRKRE